jgi:hypothetical protein
LFAHTFTFPRVVQTLKAESILDKDQVEVGDLDDVDDSNRVLAASSTASTSMENLAASDVEEGIKIVEQTTTVAEDQPLPPAVDLEEGKTDKLAEEVAEESPAVPTDIEEGVAVGEEQNRTRTGSDASSFDDDAADVPVDLGVMEETNTFIGVPYPGEAGENKKVRFVPNGCAICLSEFEAGERVTWSATKGDPHVFHEDCMMNYYLSVGAKASRRRRRHPEDQDPNQDPVEAATDFPMLCPCCRQQFVSKASPTLPDESDEDEDPKDAVPQVSVEESTTINDITTCNDDSTVSNEEEETPAAVSRTPQLVAAELV